MNNSSNHHEPSAEFRAQLKREIARAVRSDQRFGAPPAPARTRRVATAFGIGAGAVLTLLTGMVLGASASYASAAEPDAARPTFAMRPITNALTAMGCGVTKTEPQAPKSRSATPVQQQPALAASPDTATPAVQRGPNRARIAALASQHHPSVVRGDTAAQYMVMVVDAADNYLWSTYGSGSLSIEIGGDTRTAAERVAYMDQYRAEYQGDAMKAAQVFPNPKIGKLYLRYDSVLRASTLRPKLHAFSDSNFRAYFDTLNFRRGYVIGTDSARSGARSGARGGGGAGRGGIPDTLVTKFFSRRELMLDSLPMYHFARGDAFAPTGVSRVNAPDGSYRIGWGSVNAPPSERATGLVSAGNGQSGIEGLPSTWLSMGESYVFAPGELAPQMLRIVVVHLTPGTTWKGR